MIRDSKKEFIKTNLVAYVSQLNRDTGNWIHFERRVYTKENGLRYIMVNGWMFGLWEFNCADTDILVLPE